MRAFVSGGPEVRGIAFPAGVECVQLPAIQTDEDFGSLENCGSVHTLEELKDLRRQKNEVTDNDRRFGAVLDDVGKQFK